MYFGTYLVSEDTGFPYLWWTELTGAYKQEPNE
jgi:hypothetical protein